MERSNNAVHPELYTIIIHNTLAYTYMYIVYRADTKNWGPIHIYIREPLRHKDIVISDEKKNHKEFLPWVYRCITHSREFEMFCSMMSWSPSLSGRILTEKQPLWSMLPMAVSPHQSSPPSGKPWRVEASPLEEQIHKMCSREGWEMEEEEEGWDHTHHWLPWHAAAPGADSAFSPCAHIQY